MAQHATHGATVYGPAFAGRPLKPENVRNPPLRRRGLLGRRYAAKDVDEFLRMVAVDIEQRMNHEAGLLHTIGQLRLQNDSIKHDLRQWQSQIAQQMWAAPHPGGHS